MPDERRTTPVRLRGGPRPVASSDHVAALISSMRAAEVYARVISDRFELASLDERAGHRVPASLLRQLVEASDLLQHNAGRVLRQIDPNVARRVRAIASMAREHRSETAPERGS
jgi:hypothetical protein